MKIKQQFKDVVQTFWFLGTSGNHNLILVGKIKAEISEVRNEYHSPPFRICKRLI